MKRSNTEMRGGEEDEGGGGGNNRINKKSSSSTSICSILVRPLLVECLTYLDPESIRQVCLLSKEFLDMVHNDPGMDNNRVIPLLQISPSKENGCQDAGRIERVLNQLKHNQNRLQHSRAVKVIDGHKFRFGGDRTQLPRFYDTLRQRLTGVMALDLSSPTKTEFTNCQFLMTLRKILPNLREITLSNTEIYFRELEHFSKRCSQLEKITYHNSRSSMDGETMRSAKTLKEIHMDGSNFWCRDCLGIQKFSDLENVDYSNISLFHECSKGLERVSIKNATYRTYHEMAPERPIPQNALIKFVRNTPTLQWLRSDLTHENIAMLQSERHQQQGSFEIKFVQ